MHEDCARNYKYRKMLFRFIKMATNLKHLVFTMQFDYVLAVWKNIHYSSNTDSTVPKGLAFIIPDQCSSSGCTVYPSVYQAVSSVYN